MLTIADRARLIGRPVKNTYGLVTSMALFDGHPNAGDERI